MRSTKPLELWKVKGLNMSWFVVGGVAIGATAGAAIGSEKGGDDVWKGALIGGALGAAGGAGAGLGSGAGVLGGIGAETAAAGGTGAAVSGTGAAAGTGSGIFGGSVAPAAVGEIGAYGAGTAAGTGSVGLAGAGGATIPGVGTAAAMPIAGTTTAAIPGTTLAGAGAGAGGGGGILGGTAVGGVGATPTAIAGTSTAAVPGTTLSTAAAPASSTTAGGSTLGNAFNTTLKAMSDHPFLTAGAAYFGLNALGAFDNQNEGQPFGTNTQTAAGYPMSPNFKPSRVDPEKYRYTAQYAAQGGIMGYAPGGMVQQDPMNPMGNSVYPQSQQQQTAFATSPQMPNSMRAAMGADYDTRTNPMTGQEMPMGMAEGGIAHFRKGGTNYSDMAAEFAAMSDRRLGAKSPGSRSFQTRDFPSVESTGVYRDTDPATRYKNAVDAAIYQNAAQAKKYDVGGPQLKVPSGGLGSINMGPMDKEKKGTSGDAEEDFAAGGISSLGGYAHGGNPRLLRGPGDGMSDDIPATIGDRQPARLADGEFVIPADVVSALGNGSTEAGAKHLHAMMDRTRQKAHGKKTQMKKVNPKKVMPA